MSVVIHKVLINSTDNELDCKNFDSEILFCLERWSIVAVFDCILVGDITPTSANVKWALQKQFFYLRYSDSSDIVDHWRIRSNNPIESFRWVI